MQIKNHNEIPLYICQNESVSCSVLSDCLQPHGIQPTRLLCPWNSPGENTWVGCHFLLQSIFPTKGLNPHLLSLLHWQAWSLLLGPPGSPLSEWLSSKGQEITCCQGYSVQSFSHVRLIATQWTAARQASLSITNSRSLLKLISIESVIPSNLQSFPASRSFPMSQFFASGNQNIRDSASASVLPMNTYLLQDGLVGSPCRPRDSQESSPTLQFESINSLVLSFLYSPALTSIHDY